MISLRSEGPDRKRFRFALGSENARSSRLATPRVRRIGHDLIAAKFHGDDEKITMAEARKGAAQIY